MVQKQIQKMNLLIVGASGFIGKNLLLGLNNEAEIIATYNTDSNFLLFNKKHNLRNVTPIKCDLRNEWEVRKLFAEKKDFDACIYLASDTRVGHLVTDPNADVMNNILPLANFVKQYRGGPVVFFSSGAVYMGKTGQVSPKVAVKPSIPYAISKYASELYIHHYGLKGSGYVIIRFFGAYGPYEHERKLTRKLLAQIMNTQDAKLTFTIYGDGKNLIDVMYIDDAITAIKCILESGKKNLVVDLCNGTPLMINGYARKIVKLFGKTVHLNHYGSSPEYIRFYSSSDEFRRRFGFVPRISLEEGIRKYMTWLKTYKE
jgi:UDP-glucuronate 4-epimerase